MDASTPASTSGAGTDPDPSGTSPPGARLLVLSGEVASGKSTVARALARWLDATRVEADEVRRLLREQDARDGLDDPLRHFDPATEERVYAELLREAERLLWSGRSVVLDAGFPTRSSRAAARGLARAHGLGFLLVECRVDPAVAHSRLEERDRECGDSGWSELHALFARHFEPVTELAEAEHLVVDAARPVDEIVAAVGARLEAAGPAGGAAEQAPT
ncbi:MAG: AAA family ATPase [Myxococcota bacterium]